MVRVSAPAKVILFGEHAVVYGKPSIVAAIDKRVYVDLKTRNDDTITIKSNADPFELSFSLDDMRSVEGFPYIRKAIELSFENVGKKSGIDIEISSDFPPSSGLGSSASVSVATILAAHKAIGGRISKDRLAKLGHRVELEVQGAASPTDTAITTFGGILFIEPDKDKYKKIDAKLPLVVGSTGIERSTRALVEHVKALREESPKAVEQTMNGIEKITREAKKRIENGGDIGELMNMNHGLLVALEVSNFLLDRLVKAALDAGAGGSKLTGAGGGGCMIAYAPGKGPDVVAALESLGAEAFESMVATEGVRVE